MGVPKFYRWISERYPCLSEVVKEFQIPEFDNLYLDMNGIIHVCSHPEDDNPHFRITEEKIFSDIMYYIAFLFRMIKPRKVFFMAVDGVAPRAKMNQQRGRRFRSAREAEELERRAQLQGETLPTEKRFDSNCITPGTPFMVRLQEQLKYFVVQKISSDPLWQGVRVYLSGHETPGEGEHKIMDFIRTERACSDYDPNTRHCLYGLDADLMMLGLATHEPHFSLLREEVRFGRRGRNDKRPVTPEETTFHLLHLSLFREYLNFEFSPLKEKLTTFPYDLESVIDDWVLMGFLVGNDFIPHLPNLHINHDALPLLWQTYMEVLPSCGGYINNGGHLNLERFEAYLKLLSKFDFDTFSEQAGDLKWLESKKAGSSAAKSEVLRAAKRVLNNQKKTAVDNSNQFAMLNQLNNDDMDCEELGVDLMDSPMEEYSEEASEDISEEDTLDDEFRHHKRNYYMTKLEYENVTPIVLRDQAEGYVRGIQWILLYYYEGVPSWGWFYPHHYAPYISDVKDFKNMDIHFDIGTPFLPFEQLMAVLPAASKELLPKPFQDLMINDSSPIKDFYPPEFETDLNGKLQDWEAVVLIPFIKENQLLAAMRSVEHLMTAEERSRNHHGPHMLYEYTLVVLEPYPSTMPSHFPDVIPNHAKLTEVHQDAFHIDSHLLKKGVLEGVKLDVYFPGFPTLKHIPHTHELSKESVKVFQGSSRGFNMMLRILPQDIPNIDHIAKEYLGKEIFVNWPHMYEAKVVEVNNGEVSVLHDDVSSQDRKSSGISQPRKEMVDEMAFSVWQKEVASIKERYFSRLGVVIGETDVILKALPITGRKYVFGSHSRVTMEKQFGIRPVPFALQATVKDIAVHDPYFNQFKMLDEYLPKGALVFLLGWPHYGSQGEVLDTDTETGRVRINLTILEEPQLSTIVNNLQFHDEQYYEGYVISQRLGINSNLLSRVTGTIIVCAGEEAVASQQLNPHKVNIGLNLKFTKREEEIPGYTRLKEGKWMYSMKTTEIVKQYMNKFPEMFEVISRSERRHNDVYYESQVIPKGCNYTLKTVGEFIKSLPCHGLKSMKSGSDIVSEGVIKALQDQANKIIEINKKKQKRVKLQVKPHLVFKTMQSNTSHIPDSSTTYVLFDRVVNIRLGFSVPFGLRGTVVGIYPSEVEVNTMYEVIFDEDFTGGISIRSSSNRGYRMAPSALLNLTHGERKNVVMPISRSQPDIKPSIYHGDQYKNSNVSNADTCIKGYNSQDPGHSLCGFKRFNAAFQGYQSSRVYNDVGNMEWERQKQVAYSPNNQQYQPHQQRYDKSWTDAKTAMNNSQKQAAVEIPPGKVFNGANAGTSLPTFVTPRVAQNTKQPMKRGMPVNQTIVDGGNLEFENIWKQLQSNMLPPTMTTLDKTQTDTITDTTSSLMQAPASSDDRTKPTQAPPMTGDRTSLTQTTTDRGYDMALTQATQLGTVSAGITKIDVQSLFSQASICSDRKASPLATQPETTEAKSKAAVSHVVSNNEFSAMFKSLEEVHVTNEAIDKVDKNTLEDIEDGSIVMKKRMDINKETDEKTELPSESTKSYGRQLSLKELFEGVKMQQEPTVASIKENQEPEQQQVNSKVQVQQKSNQGHGQHSHQVQQPHQDINKRPAVNVPQPRGVNRNPVMELMDFCQSLHMGLPLYDYIQKQGKHYCVVSLFNGAKFPGSIFKTKEEAAESAASVALVQLKGSMQQLSHPIMPVQGYMQRIMPIWQQQFSSPNSAFSPVRFTPGFYQGQPSQGSKQYYPGYQYQGPYSVAQSQQQYNMHVNTRQPSIQPLVNPNVGRHQPVPQSAPGSLPYQCIDNRTAVNHSTDNKMVEKPSSGSLKASKEGKSQPTCVVSPFVPMQVMRKQTPQKNRKNSASENCVSKAEELEIPKVDHSTEPAAKEDNPNVAGKMIVDNKLSDTNGIAPKTDNNNSAAISVEHKTVAKSDSNPKKDSAPNSDNRLNNKPPKRRIAAKFTFDP